MERQPDTRPRSGPISAELDEGWFPVGSVERQRTVAELRCAPYGGIAAEVKRSKRHVYPYVGVAKVYGAFSGCRVGDDRYVVGVLRIGVVRLAPDLLPVFRLAPDAGIARRVVHDVDVAVADLFRQDKDGERVGRRSSVGHGADAENSRT